MTPPNLHSTQTTPLELKWIKTMLAPSLPPYLNPCLSRLSVSPPLERFGTVFNAISRNGPLPMPLICVFRWYPSPKAQGIYRNICSMQNPSPMLSLLFINPSPMTTLLHQFFRDFAQTISSSTPPSSSLPHFRFSRIYALVCFCLSLRSSIPF